MEIVSSKFSYPDKPRFGQILKYMYHNLNIGTEKEDIEVLNFVNSFLCIYKLYSNPRDMFSRVTKDRNIESRGTLRFMRLWILRLFQNDFYDIKGAINKVINILKQITKSHNDLLYEVNRIKLALLRKNNELKIKSLSNLNIGSAFAPKQTLFSFPPRKIAENLTYVEWDYFSKLNLSDFILTKENTSLSKSVGRTNRTTFWVASNILSQKTPANQVKVIRFFIEVAQFCEEMGNYNSIFGLIFGLQLGSISRLGKTWRLSRQSIIMLRRFNSLTSGADNYKNYRTVLEKRKSLIKDKIPTLPYIGVFMKDIKQVDEANPNYINKRINKNKLDLYSRIIQEIQIFQSVNYNLVKEKENAIIHHLLTLTHWTEQKIEKESERIRPRITGVEESDITYSDMGSDNSMNKLMDESSGSELVDVITQSETIDIKPENSTPRIIFPK